MELPQFSHQNKVILATPMNLFGLLRLVEHSWKVHKLSREAQEILTLGSKVYDQARIFGEKFSKLGKAVESMGKAYEDAYRSLDGQAGMLPKIRKLKDYGCAGAKPLPDELFCPDSLNLITSNIVHH
jgi:DNA recombination protein RmuC